MEKERSPKTIQIPKWINNAVSELALKHNRDVGSEIESLVKAALEREAGTGNRLNPAVGEKARKNGGKPRASSSGQDPKETKMRSFSLAIGHFCGETLNC
jgi:hypothetical protein